MRDRGQEAGLSPVDIAGLTAPVQLPEHIQRVRGDALTVSLRQQRPVLARHRAAELVLLAHQQHPDRVGAQMLPDRPDRFPHDILDLQMFPDPVAEFAGNTQQPHGLGQIALLLARPRGRVTRRPGQFAGPAVLTSGHHPSSRASLRSPSATQQYIS